MSTAKLLVSVRSKEEATLALQGGADIIDIKEPLRGSLGRSDFQTIHEIAAVVGNHAKLSVAMGELAEMEQDEPSLVASSLPDGIAFIKIGLAGECHTDSWQKRLAAMFAQFPEVSAVPVAYWDAHRVSAPSPDDVLNWAIQHHAAAILIDTADKNGPGLLAMPDDVPKLIPLLASAHAHHLPVAIAGKLVGPTFAAAADLTLLSHGPAILGVRSAACLQNQRQGDICPKAIAMLREVLVNRQ